MRNGKRGGECYGYGYGDGRGMVTGLRPLSPTPVGGRRTGPAGRRLYRDQGCRRDDTCFFKTTGMPAAQVTPSRHQATITKPSATARAARAQRLAHRLAPGTAHGIGRAITLDALSRKGFN